MVARTTVLVLAALLSLGLVQVSAAFRPFHFPGARMPSLFADPFASAPFFGRPLRHLHHLHHHSPSTSPFADMPAARFQGIERLLAELLQEEQRLSAHYNKLQLAQSQQQQQQQQLLEQQKMEEVQQQREEALREQQLREQQLREQQLQRALLEKRLQEEQARREQARREYAERQRAELERRQRLWEEQQNARRAAQQQQQQQQQQALRQREQQLKEAKDRILREEQVLQQQKRTLESASGADSVEYVSRGPFRKQVVQKKKTAPASSEPAVPGGYEVDEDGTVWQAGGIWVGEKDAKQPEPARAHEEREQAMEMLRRFLDN
jgi:hypothetical protein